MKEEKQIPLLSLLIFSHPVVPNLSKHLIDYLVTLDKVIDLWVPLYSVVWRGVLGTAFTDFYLLLQKLHKTVVTLIICYAVWYLLLYFIQHDDCDPLSWFHNPLMGSDIQFEKHCDKVNRRRYLLNKWIFFSLVSNLDQWREAQWACLWFCV